MTTIETLNHLPYFIDNDFLVKYCQLVDRHKRSRCVRGKTNRHHILPRAYFNLTGQEVNNDPNNLVDLPYREHILAHYYLCLCTKDPLCYANQLALFCLLGRKKKVNDVDTQLIRGLPMYESIYKSYIVKKKNGYQIYSGGIK